MNRSKCCSHLFEGLFKESRNPVRNSLEAVSEAMKSKADIFTDNVLLSEMNLV